MPTRRLLTVAHSYVVALNRRLAEEMARAGTAAGWEVVAAAPEFVRGDLRPIRLEPGPGYGTDGNGRGPSPLRVEPVPFRLSRFPHLAAYGRRLARLMARGWDVVHCWEEPYIVAGAQAAAWAPARSRLVYSTFQNIPKSYPPPFCWLERFAMSRADGWTAFGWTVEAALIRRPGYRSRPRRVIPVGVDTDAFRPDPAAGREVRRRLGWAPDGPPVVGYLGRFVPEKGLATLTAALDSLADTPWRAMLVGGGPMEPDLRAWAGRHGDRVRIVTGVPHDGVPAHLAAMDVLAAPSRTTPRWREQLGRMLLEAFACGTPVAASDSGEIPHVVADAGVVVGEADAPGWRAALAGLLESPARRAELAARGRERALREYAWPVVAGRYLEFFGELMEGQRR
jgi:glycosyltransferase involved in cell wall biosynthesis